jgi:mannose-6-phosphate isomerase-like protein (cupin superfamily)
VPITARGSRHIFAPAERRVESRRHRTVEEVWSVISGTGRMWRKLGEHEEIVELGPGVSLTIPTSTHFQFRCDGDERLDVIGATMPPWPGKREAYFVEGAWRPTV